MTRTLERLRDFLFQADSDLWVSILRVGLALQAVLYAWSLRDDWNPLFTRHAAAPVSRTLTEALVSAETRYTPRFGWLVTMGEHLGLSEGMVLTLAWFCLIAAASCLLAGLFCRLNAFVTWFLYLCSVKSGALFSYGVDSFTTIGLFYLMIAPLPDQFSLDAKLGARRTLDPGRLGFHRRVLQIHLCIIYFFGGMAKCLGADWWNGNSVWRALTRPPFDLVSPDVLIRLEYLLPVIGISVCLLETGYPVFIWMKRTKALWLVGILLMHLSIGLTMGLYLFALIMMVLNLSAFGPDFLPRSKFRLPVSSSSGDIDEG